MTHIYITPSANQIISPVAVSGANDNEQIIITDVNDQEWLLVAADAQLCLFEAVEHREIGNAPRTRTMPLKAVQKLYGWDKPQYDRRYVRTANDFGGMGIQVYCDHEQAGYGLAEPIWASRLDDREIDLDWERAQMNRILSRDSDRAANFELTLGALI